MEIELDREDPSQRATLATLPRFNAAEIQRRRLLVLILASGALAAALLGAAAKSDSAIARSLLSFNGAALLLLCAGLQSAYWVARWRSLTLGILVSRVPAWLRPRPVDSAPDTLLGDWARLHHRLGKAGRFVSSHISDAAYEATWVGVSAYLALLIVRRELLPRL